MPISDYVVQRDKFELNEFGFPCHCCMHRSKPEYVEPCRTCDHNISAVPDDDTKI